MPQLLKIDDLCRGDHSFLRNDDECYYFLEYTAGGGFATPGNQLVMNFKKPVDKKGTPQWRYKGIAIRQVAEMLFQNIPSVVPLNECTLVPIPPSKSKTNPLYDDRALQALGICCRDAGDVKEAITLSQDMQPAHGAARRMRPEELTGFLEINLKNDENLAPIVILFDDVVTTGCHYVACKQKLLERFPGTRVIGIFIARRVIPNTAALDFADVEV